MTKKFNSKLYLNYSFSTEKAADGNRYWKEDPDGYLFADGRWRTKIKPEDIPDWYVYGYMYKRHGFISAKGVVDIIYEPDYFVENHVHKYDNLFVSFTHKLTRVSSEYGHTHCEDYDYILDAGIIYNYLKKVKIYSPQIEVEEMLREAEMKVAWYKMRKDNGPLTITPETPIRVFRAWMDEPYFVGVAFNDGSYWMLDMKELAKKLPKVAACLDYFSEPHQGLTDVYCYGISFDCGLHLTAEECYNYKVPFP
ncbi:MAG: hypothetical protein NC548_51410, partial [Lachnospiraceae bacterium]|nr:hypothetical protein [Lachnospiraceae bacterium]